jgi:hypothetical protein
MTRDSHQLAIVLAVAALMAWPSGAGAQTQALQTRLATAKTLTCTFSVVATGNWKEGAPEATTGQAKRTVAFSNVNIDEGTADAGGDLGGSSFIVVRQSTDYLHLMQSHSGGQLYTTTVFARETKEGRLMAVHTRHEYTDVRLPGYTSRPEMYLGDCTVGS